MASQQPAILVKDLTKHFGDFTAVDRVSFNVQRGEIFGFLGPNGSGKTTTIRMMLGLLKPTAGSVVVLDMKVNGDTSKIRPRVGYMSQKFSLYNDLTVRQNLNFYGAAYGLATEELHSRIEEALVVAGLEGQDDVKTGDLSGGWRQRLALGASILHRPEVLFLDEPTAGVDPLSRRAFWDLLYKLTAEGVTVFVTTHYMDEAEHCHRLAFIQHGKLIANGTLGEIRSKMLPGDVLEIASSDSPLTVKLLRAAQANGAFPIEEIELYGALVHLILRDAGNYLPAIERELQSAGIHLEYASIIEPTLEDVFISAMKV